MGNHIVVLLIVLTMARCADAPTQDPQRSAFPPQDDGCRLPTCRYLAKDIPPMHGNGGYGTSLRTYPQLDDNISRWGDCVETIVQCFERSPKSDAASCFNNAPACAPPCTAEAAQRTRRQIPAEIAFLEVFALPGGPCRPSVE